MQNIRKYSLSLLLTLWAVASYSQDAMLFLSNTVPLYHNPANTGNELFSRAAINYRNHYPSTGNAYVTYTAGFDTYFDNINSGLGIMYMRDEQGSRTYVRNMVNLAYSYSLKLNDKSTIRAGLLGSINNWNKNPYGLIFPDMIGSDGSEIANSEVYDKTGKTYVDFAFGTTFNTNRLTLGASVYHLGTSAERSFGTNEMRLYAHGQYRIPFFGKKMYVPLNDFQSILSQSSISPIAYYWQQGDTKLFGMGADLQLSNFNMALFSRQNFKLRAVTFSMQLGFTAASMGIHYNIDLGYLSKNTKGLSASSHEIAIVFRFGKEDDD